MSLLKIMVGGITLLVRARHILRNIRNIACYPEQIRSFGLFIFYFNPFLNLYTFKFKMLSQNYLVFVVIAFCNTFTINDTGKPLSFLCHMLKGTS